MARMAYPTVAFQGERGSFSEEAAYKLLGHRARVLPCETFAGIFESVASGKTRFCLAPIENTLAGSVHENYDLLLKHDLHIVGEVNLHIVHNLIALPGVKLRDVRQVYSHPVALAQCGRFFSEHSNLQKVPYYDTAGSVKMLTERKLRDAAAIASGTAASFYRAKILKLHLEDHRENYTRFLLLSKKPTVSRRADKISIVFSTRNQPGSLFRCLSVFALRDVNLAKLESRPLRGKPWEYFFYLDFVGNVKDERSRKALDHLAEIVDFSRVLGCYESGKR